MPNDPLSPHDHAGDDSPGQVRAGVLRPMPAGRAAKVHPGSFVDPKAELGPGVEIGPGAVVGPDVKLAAGVRVGAHAILTGDLEVGEATRIFPHAVVGEEPQDRSFSGEHSAVRIGPRCKIREGVTVHRGTGLGTTTEVGADVLLMANCHVGHNCRIGNDVILGSGVLLAGHVQIHDQAVVSGNVVVHQFTRIGRMAMIGGASRVARDVPPFTMLVGNSRIRGLNSVGIVRKRIPREAQIELRRAYRVLYRSGYTLREALHELARIATTAEALELLDFLSRPSHRGICSSARSSSDND